MREEKQGRAVSLGCEMLDDPVWNWEDQVGRGTVAQWRDDDSSRDRVMKECWAASERRDKKRYKDKTGSWTRCVGTRGNISPGLFLPKGSITTFYVLLLLLLLVLCCVCVCVLFFWEVYWVTQSEVSRL